MPGDGAVSDPSIRDAVAASAQECLELCQALVRLPTENPPGEVEAATEWLASWLEGRAHQVERHPVPTPFARHYGRGDITNLVVRRRFGEGPTIALHAPLDTLPAGGSWRREPFGGEVRDGVLHGRGARDSKADVAAYIFALEALASAGQRRGTVELHLTADEESGGFLGPAFLLSQGFSAPDAVIAAGTSYQVVTGQQGVLHLEVLLRGVQAHASRPGDGRDAIAAAVPLLAMLHEEGARSSQPLTVSTIEGGRGVNLLADEVRLTIDRRLGEGDDGDAVEAALVEAIGAAHRSADVELECRRLLLAEPVSPTPPSERLAANLSAHASRVLGEAVPVVSAPVVSGARHYALAGIATALYGVGPKVVGEGVDLTGEESVPVALIAKTTEVLGRTLAERLSE